MAIRKILSVGTSGGTSMECCRCKKIKLLKEELITQFDSYGYNKAVKDIPKHTKDKVDNTTESTARFDNVLSAKKEWESCVDALEHQVIVLLDKNLKVIRANRTVELWGWADVTKVRGIHILNLITPAIQHDSSNEWIDEWCQLDTQSNAEWVSSNYKTGKTYRFTFFPNKNSNNSTQQNENSYAVMLITDISNQNNLQADENKFSANKDTSAKESDETDLIRLSAYRLHQLANRLIQSQEDERKRVSSELHDGLGQILSALKYKVELAVIESEKQLGPKKTDAALNDILKNVTIALTELRRVSTDLRPSVLEDLGIILALKWFADEYNKIYTKLNVEFYIDVIEADIADKNKTIIYRIVQESMNNIAKHSDAKNIYVHLVKSKRGILLQIKDDGSGFDLKKVKQRKKSGMGLKSMEERAVKSGAKFTMKSSASTGTVVQVFWNNN